jgi:hypothetical protein
MAYSEVKSPCTRKAVGNSRKDLLRGPEFKSANAPARLAVKSLIVYRANPLRTRAPLTRPSNGAHQNQQHAHRGHGDTHNKERSQQRAGGNATGVARAWQI